MRNNIPGITMVPIHTEIAMHLRTFATDQKNMITPNQSLVIKRWAGNSEVMEELGLRFFEEWETGGRQMTVEQFALKVAQDVLSAYS